uniref:Uncharacterized protein n=1 Tax=Rhizophora mucronata TaxID=61149 RepID=A0A2P2N568_RHIMU
MAMLQLARQTICFRARNSTHNEI